MKNPEYLLKARSYVDHFPTNGNGAGKISRAEFEYLEDRVAAIEAHLGITPPPPPYTTWDSGSTGWDSGSTKWDVNP